ncbi:hypothetical protein Ciccas_008532 [Cichlidogyrus casuarinus]|uniref:MHC class I antigen n=1 Tax=Cichlidogyrus casuarinus TaxID=1844966 RepID=A0ABD2PZM7_9PLAT
MLKSYDPREGVDPWEVDESVFESMTPRSEDWNPVVQRRGAFWQATRDGILDTIHFYSYDPEHVSPRRESDSDDDRFVICRFVYIHFQPFKSN